MKTTLLRRIVISLVLSLAFSLINPARAQIIILDGQSGSRQEVEGDLPFIPGLGVSYDQYAPLTGGILLLSFCAASYGFLKRKKNT